MDYLQVSSTIRFDISIVSSLSVGCLYLCQKAVNKENMQKDGRVEDSVSPVSNNYQYKYNRTRRDREKPSDYIWLSPEEATQLATVFRLVDWRKIEFIDSLGHGCHAVSFHGPEAHGMLMPMSTEDEGTGTQEHLLGRQEEQGNTILYVQPWFLNPYVLAVGRTAAWLNTYWII